MTESKAGSVRKLYQTRISNYFVGPIKRIPQTEMMPLKKKRVYKRCQKVSISSTNEESNSLNRRKSALPSFEEYVNISKINVPKRKLPKSILSDDESDETDQSEHNNIKSADPNNGNQSVSLNASSSSVPSKSSSSLKPLSSSTPSSSAGLHRKRLFHDSVSNLPLTTSAVYNHAGDPCCSKSLPVDFSKSPARTSNVTKTDESSSKIVHILENVVIRSPGKSPKKIIKVEKENLVKREGKLNYDHVKVINEFFDNVLKSNHLKSLLSSDDKDMLYRFFGSDKSYQYVCMKLFMWKPMWYNIFKYLEKIQLTMIDSDVTRMYEYLKANKFVDTDYMVEESYKLLNILGVKELREIHRSFKLPKTDMTKDGIINKLLKNCDTQSTLTCSKNMEAVLRERIKEKMGFCVKLSSRFTKCLYHVFLLNTFTNSDLVRPQDYFTNTKYFNVVFPSYKVEDFHIFYTEEEFSKYAVATQLYLELETAIEKRNNPLIFQICERAFAELKRLEEESGTSFDKSREPHLERFTSNTKYIRIVTQGAERLTTTYSTEVRIWMEHLISQKYCNYLRGNWYCRLALIYTQYLKDYEKAAKLIIDAFNKEKENFSEVQLHELAHRGNILNRKSYNLSALSHDTIASLSPRTCDRNWPHTMMDCKSMDNEQTGRKRLYVHRRENGDVNYLSVEQTAMEYYRTLGYPSGEHCEGSLIIASFCLLFWDIIYEEYVKGTFVSKVQDAPLDMYTPLFYTNREHLIKKRLKDIAENWKEEELKKTVIDNWTRHSHESGVRHVDSIVNDPVYLFNVIICIGRNILSKIFERLVKNFKVYRSGFPDLLLWNLEEKKAKFVEVKGENDTLSIKQKLWLNYLMDIGASIEICYVEPKASKKKIKTPEKKMKT
jgi:Fanconi-associated nuclease 1